MSNKKSKKCLTRPTKYDIIITQGNTNTKGSEQMSEKQKESLTRLAETVSQLDKENFNYILGVADGMAISKKQSEVDKQIAMCGSVK
jgi:hypothetical protein|nr:MAG TPA: hypothetical protein [Caudoviricetes sp.]